MRRPSFGPVVCGALFGFLVSTGLLASGNRAKACGDESYHSRGVVRSIADDRGTVAITHEPIAGYLPAKTSTFEVRTSAQLTAVGVGDRVTFAFTLTDSGRRLLDSIGREARPARAGADRFLAR